MIFIAIISSVLIRCLSTFYFWHNPIRGYVQMITFL